MATAAQRETIYRARHEVYAHELGQHQPNASGRLVDALDDRNLYVVACRGDDLLGFVSVTPPQAGSYSIDKYFARDDLPFEVDGLLYEVRLLTVLGPHRCGPTSSLLMLAALRLALSQGASRIAAIGRSDLRGFYERVGLQMHGLVARSGAVTYELMSATAERMRACLRSLDGVVRRIERVAVWDPALRDCEDGCYHGGASFDAIGDAFDDLGRAAGVVSADVLDAWFPPSPRAVGALSAHGELLLRASPPTMCAGLVRTIAAVRSLPMACVVVGAGSSDLMFRALRLWLDPGSRALLPEPTYGEYEHLLGRVIGCQVDRLRLGIEAGFGIEVDDLLERLTSGRYDILILVNPNNPTGRLMPREDLRRLLELTPASTRVWLDEAYVDYADPEATCEQTAARLPNLVVCKSLSKAYALSGARAAYLVADADTSSQVRRITPPWVVSLPAQAAAVAALGDGPYYRARWAETALLRARLADALRDAIPRLTVCDSCANFLLCLLPEGSPTSDLVCESCRLRNVFVRDMGDMGQGLGSAFIRVAVKDAAANARVVAALREALAWHRARGARPVRSWR